MGLLADMQQKGLAPNSITYRAAISACEKAKQPHKVMVLVAGMRQKGLAPYAVAFSAAIRAFEEAWR